MKSIKDQVSDLKSSIVSVVESEKGLVYAQQNVIIARNRMERLLFDLGKADNAQKD